MSMRCTSIPLSELPTVTQEQVEQHLESVFEMIEAGHSPILIMSDGKPDLLMFSWSDFKRRFSLLYSPEELERIEEEMRRCRRHNELSYCRHVIANRFDT